MAPGDTTVGSRPTKEKTLTAKWLLGLTQALQADAIRGYLESLRKDGQPIPTDIAIPAAPRKEHISVALDAA